MRQSVILSNSVSTHYFAKSLDAIRRRHSLSYSAIRALSGVDANLFQLNKFICLLLTLQVGRLAAVCDQLMLGAGLVRSLQVTLELVWCLHGCWALLALGWSFGETFQSTAMFTSSLNAPAYLGLSRLFKLICKINLKYSYFNDAGENRCSFGFPFVNCVVISQE